MSSISALSAKDSKTAEAAERRAAFFAARASEFFLNESQGRYGSKKQKQKTHPKGYVF